MPLRVISNSLSAVLILIFSAVDNFGVGVGLGDTDGDTVGFGDKLGDGDGDTFLSPLVSPVLSPLSLPCGLPTLNVGLVDNSLTPTSDVLWPSDVGNPSLTPDVAPPSGVVNESPTLIPNKPTNCAHRTAL